MLIEVDSEYKIYSERLNVLEKQFDGVLSLTAYGSIFRHSVVLKRRAHLLKSSGQFEVQVLAFWQ